MRGQVLSENFCRYTIYKVLSGLHAMHQELILHRDLNAENIYLNQRGDIKLGDLGVSEELKNELVNIETESNGQSLRSWLSPEIVRGEKYS